MYKNFNKKFTNSMCGNDFANFIKFFFFPLSAVIVQNLKI